MDDLFFTDRNNKNGGKNPPGRNSHDQFITDDFDDENLDFVFGDDGSREASDGKEPFSVSIPDDEYSGRSNGNPAAGRNRTPRGKPVGTGYSDVYSSSQGESQRSRTPQGKPRAYTDDYDVSSASPSYNGNEPAAGRARAPQSAAYGDVRSNGGRPRPPMGSAERGKRKKKSNVGKRIAVTILVLVLLCFTAIFAYGYSLLGKINYDTETLGENQYISDSELVSDSGVKNILFIGSDARSEIEGMRSDTMLLFSIDKVNKKIKLTSFLRDSYVYLPTSGKNRKLNAACSAGGAQLVIDTIEYNFKVKIDNYILVDFEAFQKLVDLMGGLTVEDVTAREAQYLRDTVKIVYAKEGTNKFSGAATLWYCRIRYLDDDFHRTQRQRKVISALVDQAKHTNPATLMQIMQEVLPMITTDISRNELLSLGVGAAAKYMRYDIVQHQVPADGTWSNLRVPVDGAVLNMDIAKNAQLLEQFIYSDSAEDSES